MIRYTDEQPNEGIHRARSGRVPGAGASVPMELECSRLPVWMCSPTCKLPEHCTIGILWRFLHVGRKLHFQPLSLLSRMKTGDDISKLLIMAWSFW